MMIQRRFFTIIFTVQLFLAMVSCCTYAQTSSKRYLEKWWRSDSVFYTVPAKGAGAILSKLPFPAINKLTLSYLQQENTPNTLVSFPKSFKDYKLFANGLKRVKTYTFYSEASFAIHQENELSHNIVYHSDIFYPYIISDTVSHQYKTESYHVAFDASKDLNPHWSIGLGAQYNGDIRHTRTDPRVKNVASSIQIAGSAIHAFSPQSLLSFQIAYTQMMEQISFQVYRQGSTEDIYVMRPLGEFNFKYSGRVDNGAYRAKNKGIFASLHFLQSTRNLDVQLGMGYDNGRLYTTEAGVYLSELKRRHIYALGKMDIWNSHTLGIFALKMEYDYRPANGDERIYEDVQVDDHISLYNQELLSVNKIYKCRDHNWQIGLDWRLPLMKQQLSAGLTYKGMQHQEKQTQENLHNDWRTHEIQSCMTLRIKKPKKDLYGSTKLGFDYYFAKHTDALLNTEQKTYLIEDARQHFILDKRYEAILAQDLYYAVGAKKNQYLYLRAQFGITAWQSAAHTHYYTFTFGYLFD